MKKRAALIAFLAVSISPGAHAQANQWHPFFEGQDGSETFVANSISKNRAGEARVWTYIDYPTKQFDSTIGIFTSIQQQFLIDCRSGQYSLLQLQAYDGPGLSGRRTFDISNSDAEAHAGLRDPSPSSMLRRLMETICH